jgi:hypothetical protein
MLKKLVRNYLSSGLDHSGDSLLRLKYTMVNGFTLIGVTFVFAIGIFNLARDYTLLGGLQLFGGSLCVVNVILLRRTRNIEFASGVILFGMLCLFATLLVLGGNDRTGLFWFCTYPLLALFLKGSPRGFIWLAFQFLVTAVLTVMSELRVLVAIPYTPYEMVMLGASLLAVTLIVFFYERLKNDFLSLQKKRGEDLVKKKIIDDQFAIAERIQRLLIPGDDRVFGRLAVSGYYKAAAGVGGDYYDFFEIDRDHTALIMCDVSGKSVSAAFVMVNIRSIFQHNIGRADMNPAAMVKLLNRAMLADSTSDIFAVLSVFMFNNPTRTAVFCHAGYGPFTFYSKKKDRIIEVPSNSLPVGVIEDDSNYVNRAVPLEPGDVILSYTDGVLDGFEKNSETSDKTALYRLVRDKAGETPALIKQAIVAAIGAGARDLPDDVSLVISKVL